MKILTLVALLLPLTVAGQTNEQTKYSIIVDRSDYMMTVFKEGQPMMEQRVVLGKPHRRTPLITTHIDRVEFNPYWDVPRRIAHDIFQKIASSKNPLALIHEKGYQFIGETGVIDPKTINWKTANHSYRVRQQPGEVNMLGRVMFVLANSDEVQMHDTPMKELFNEEIRGFSSGCIRVHDAVTLAATLLETDADSIHKKIEDGKNKYTFLNQKVPVRVVE